MIGNKLTLSDIEWVVASKYGLSKAEIRSDSHLRRIARPRQIAMYMAREILGYSWSRIGVYFGRDHTTVLHAWRKIANLKTSNLKVARHVKECHAAIYNYQQQKPDYTFWLGCDAPPFEIGPLAEAA